MNIPKSILVSRTDAIGDVVLTLPVATILRNAFPDARIGFLGREYTRPVVACCSAVDCFIEEAEFLNASSAKLRTDWDAIIHVFPKKAIAVKAWKAKIRLRVGTSSRIYHRLTCNALVPLSRRHSLLHEAQLNAQLLSPFGVRRDWTREELGKLFSLDKLQGLPEQFAGLFRTDAQRRFILHPKSQGSAREWPLERYVALIRILHAAGNVQLFISGTAAERKALEPLFREVGSIVTDITGIMSLSEFISFIDACDGLVAASTGPLHIAAALGKTAIGLYPSIRPMHAGRWGPLGIHAHTISMEKECTDCRKRPDACHCINEILPADVVRLLIEG